jgi:hypothetical protein
MYRSTRRAGPRLVGSFALTCRRGGKSTVFRAVFFVVLSCSMRHRVDSIRGQPFQHLEGHGTENISSKRTIILSVTVNSGELDDPDV